MRKIICGGLFFALLMLITSLCIYAWVSYSAFEQTYDSVNQIPYNKVGLLLGTSKYISKGKINLYYKYRIDAALQLYKAKKISYLLLSGDNRTKQYNEPETMKKDLIALGVPVKVIYLDYAGFRTFDSIIRCAYIFGQQNFTVISQKFHNQRAIYIANHEKLNVIGFNTKQLPLLYQIKVQIREVMARVKMLMDLLLNKQPKFLGNKIQIPH